MKVIILFFTLLFMSISCSKIQDNGLSTPKQNNIIYDKVHLYTTVLLDTLVYDKRTFSVVEKLPLNIDSLDNWHKKYYLSNTYKFIITYTNIDFSDVKNFKSIRIRIKPEGVSNNVIWDINSSINRVCYIRWDNHVDAPYIIVYPGCSINDDRNNNPSLSTPTTVVTSPIKIKNNIISYITSIKVLEYTFIYGSDAEVDYNPYRTVINEYGGRELYDAYLINENGERLTEYFKF